MSLSENGVFAVSANPATVNVDFVKEPLALTVAFTISGVVKLKSVNFIVKVPLVVAVVVTLVRTSMRGATLESQPLLDPTALITLNPPRVPPQVTWPGCAARRLVVQLTHPGLNVTLTPWSMVTVLVPSES